jgi:hypothetical protein
MNLDYDNLFIFLAGIGCACIILAFMLGYVLGVDAMAERKEGHNPALLPMRMED